MRSILWIAAALAVNAALLSGCGGSSGPADSGAPSPKVVVSVTPPSGANLTVDKAIQVARDAATAAKYIDSGGVQKVTVNLDPSGAWTVTFKGMFYKPEKLMPRPVPTGVPRQRLCSEVTVTVTDSTGIADEWTFAPTNSCS